MEQDLCRQEMLSAYIDGELTRDARARVETHLERCIDCSALVEEMSRLSVGLAGIPRPEPKADLAAQIISRVRLSGVENPDLLFGLLEMWGIISLLLIAILSFLMYSFIRPFLVVLRGMMHLAFSIGKYFWGSEIAFTNLLIAGFLIAAAGLVFYWFIRIKSNSGREVIW